MYYGALGVVRMILFSCHYKSSVFELLNVMTARPPDLQICFKINLYSRTLIPSDSSSLDFLPIIQHSREANFLYEVYQKCESAYFPGYTGFAKHSPPEQSVRFIVFSDSQEYQILEAT